MNSGFLRWMTGLIVVRLMLTLIRSVPPAFWAPCANASLGSIAPVAHAPPPAAAPVRKRRRESVMGSLRWLIPTSFSSSHVPALSSPSENSQFARSPGEHLRARARDQEGVLDVHGEPGE